MANAAPAWEDVNSSALKRWRYHPDTQKLQVEFRGQGDVPGKIAEYDNVTPQRFAALQGKHFHAHIKGNANHDWRYL